jgi:hypothetical protein
VRLVADQRHRAQPGAGMFEQHVDGGLRIAERREAVHLVDGKGVIDGRGEDDGGLLRPYEGAREDPVEPADAAPPGGGGSGELVATLAREPARLVAADAVVFRDAVPQQVGDHALPVTVLRPEDKVGANILRTLSFGGSNGESTTSVALVGDLNNDGVRELVAGDSPGFLLLSPPLLQPTNLGVPDCNAYVDIATAIVLLPIAPGTGRWTLPLPVPSLPGFAGLEFEFQVIYGPTSGPLGFDLTNGLRWRIGW